MSVQTEIDRLETAKAAIGTAIAGKGVAVPSGTKLDGMAALINGIEQGSDPVLQSKTVTPSTSAKTVKPDSGYDGLSQVTVNAMPTATQATPSISVSSGGLITASATQTAGYVAAGTKSATQQMTVQAAQTITPGTADKTIASGRYLTGTQTIKGDGNLLADNIKAGVSIFGVAGTFEGSGGGSSDGEQLSILDTGTVTYSKTTTVKSVKISHNSGVVPKAFWIHTTDNTTSKNGLMSMLLVNIDGEIFGLACSRTTSTNIGNLFVAPVSAGKTLLWTNTTIDNSSHSWGNWTMKTGVTYTWWCIG